MIGTLDYFLYMAEAEGCDDIVTTDTAKINACINDFCDAYYRGKDINDDDIQDNIFHNHGFSRYSLTDKEIRYIIQEVERRIS